MGTCIIRRLRLTLLHLLGIMAINFAMIQLAPGGPVEGMFPRSAPSAMPTTTCGGL